MWDPEEQWAMSYEEMWEPEQEDPLKTRINATPIPPFPDSNPFTNWDIYWGPSRLEEYMGWVDTTAQELLRAQRYKERLAQKRRRRRKHRPFRTRVGHGKHKRNKK